MRGVPSIPALQCPRERAPRPMDREHIAILLEIRLPGVARRQPCARRGTDNP